MCLGYLRAGNTLVVWRLGRSLRHLVETVNALAGRGVAFASLHEGIDTTTSTGVWSSISSLRSLSSSGS